MLARIRSFISAKLGKPSSEAESSKSELERLEAHLLEEKQKTEAMARISYTKWKLRNEQEKAYAIKYGVTMPLTSAQREQDDFFRAFEARMKAEQLDYEERQRSLEYKAKSEAEELQSRADAEEVVQILEGEFK
jgi:hypothetical protein